eukprot:jgi/Bigna1/146356/aug1.113_g21064
MSEIGDDGSAEVELRVGDKSIDHRRGSRGQGTDAGEANTRYSSIDDLHRVLLTHDELRSRREVKMHAARQDDFLAGARSKQHSEVRWTQHKRSSPGTHHDGISIHRPRAGDGGRIGCLRARGFDRSL